MQDKLVPHFLINLNSYAVYVIIKISFSAYFRVGIKVDYRVDVVVVVVVVIVPFIKEKCMQHFREKSIKMLIVD